MKYPKYKIKTYGTLQICLMNFLSFFCSMNTGKNEIKKETSFEDLCNKY